MKINSKLNIFNWYNCHNYYDTSKIQTRKMQMLWIDKTIEIDFKKS